MKTKIITALSLAITLAIVPAATHAQDFKRQQATQEGIIKTAKREGKITDIEYAKLMKEQAVIKETIARAEDDGIWTSKEKNAVAAKLDKASRRLRRYENNREIY